MFQTTSGQLPPTLEVKVSHSYQWKIPRYLIPPRSDNSIVGNIDLETSVITGDLTMCNRTNLPYNTRS